MILTTDPAFYAVAALAVILVGLGKGGFIGMGALGMPILTLVMDPIKAAAVMLPILIVQDAVGVWAFRKTWDAQTLKTMLPGAAIGIFLGWMFASRVEVNLVEGVIGVIALVFGGQRLLATAGLALQHKGPLPEYFGTFWGAISGFTSQIAHAGGPPFQVWAITKGLSRDVYAGTSLIFFALVNWAKVPAYLALGQFTRENLINTALLMPVAIASTFAGVALVKWVDAKRFFMAVHVLMVIVGIVLIRRALLQL